MPKWPRLGIQPWVYYIHLVGLIWNGFILTLAMSDGASSVWLFVRTAFFLLVVIFTQPEKE